MSDSFKSKQQRLQAVRKQEADLARQSSKSFQHSKTSENKLSSLVIPNKEKARQDKIQEIETLQQQKSYCLANLGKAQEEAEQEEKRIQEQIRKKEIFLKEAQIKAKARGDQALKVHQELEQKRQLEENLIKDRRAEVLQKEYELAKELAQQFREKQALLEEERRKEEELNYVRPGGTLVYGKIDYSKTHFHNPVILVHDVEDGKNAKEVAEEEHRAAAERFQVEQEIRVANESKACERGEAALMKVAVERELAKLSKELEKIRKADGNNKIARGQEDPTSQNRCIVKMTQEYSKKQQKLEQAFETIFAEKIPEPELENLIPMNKKLKPIPKPQKEEIHVHEIPIPVVEQELHETENSLEISKNKEELKESQGFSKYLKDKKPETLESPQSEDFELSQSESEAEELLPAKYVPKASKKAKKPQKSQKKNESISLKKPNQEVKISKKAANIIEDDFKDHLDEEYQKHLQIKKKIEELKKFSAEPSSKKPEPPSVLSSQISPQIVSFSKNQADVPDYEYLPKKLENFNMYSKIKNEFADSREDAEEKTPESSLDSANDLRSQNFLEEMKMKYGIQSSGKKSEESLEREEKNVSAEKNPIFSDRTLKLMKEIEEKYSLDKYKIKDEDEDIRFTLPFAKVVGKASDSPKFVQKHVDEESESGEADNYEVRSEEYYQKSEESSHENHQKSEESSGRFKENYLALEKPYGNDEFSDNEEEYSSKVEEKYEVSESIPEENEDFEQRDSYSYKIKKNEDQEDEGKFSFNEKFFNELKAKYGFSDDPRSKTSDEAKIIVSDYKYSNDHKQRSIPNKYEKSPEKNSESELSEDSLLRPKIKKSSGILVEDSVAEGKSLAEIFKERNQKAMSKIHERESSINKATHKEKSKDELMEIRKEQLKGKHELNPEAKPENKVPVNPVLERLGKGEKPKISKKEMHELTKKNYEMLPEVKKRKEEERKKQEVKERIQKSKEFEKVIFI